MLASPNSRLRATPRFFLGMLLALGICFGVQAFVYYGLNWKTGKGESNYFSTLSRFQAAASPSAEFAFVGSSITGRLPGREVGNDNIANLGSDGGPALDGIDMLANGNIALPRWLVIEVNTLYGGVGFGESLIARYASGPWFDVGASMPLLGASARPSSMLYAQLLRRPKVLTGEAFAVQAEVIAPIVGNPIDDFTDEEKARFQNYVSAIEKLHQRGVKIVLVNYPAGKMSEREEFLIRSSIAQFSLSFPLWYLDLEKQIPRNALQYTDAVHLGPDSAVKILKTMTEFCEIQQSEL